MRFEARRLAFEAFAPATRVTKAEARGKHCLVHFDDGRTLRTHLRMLRRRLLATAAALFRANVDTPDRTTQPEGGLAVYGRADRPCRRCATTIRSAKQGKANRGSYWCPTCQPAGPSRIASPGQDAGRAGPWTR